MKQITTALLIAGAVLALNVLVQIRSINQYNSSLEASMVRSEGWK